MFEFLFQNKAGEIENMAEIITTNMKKVELSKLAIEKCVNMISDAIARSEIVLTDGKERQKNEAYYRLNIMPNDNETGTEFWKKSVYKMLTTGECVIVRMKSSGKYYVADSYSEDAMIMRGRKYYDVYTELKGTTYKLNGTFKAEDVMVLRYKNEKIRTYLWHVLKSYDQVMSAVNTMMKKKHTPILKWKVNGSARLVEKPAKDGEAPKMLSDDAYKEKLRAMMESDELVVLKEALGHEHEFMKIDSSVTPDDISKMSVEIGKQAAEAFNIPELVYFGTITEKSDATNEFITYAVKPVAEIIDDSLNAKLVGMEDYLKGERAYIWLARFKHVDVIDSASNLDKLRSIGFNIDEIRDMVGYDPLNNEFGKERALTKNYSTVTGTETE